MVAAILLVGTCVAALLSTVKSANGDWKLEYPPWGETDTPTHGAPKVWFPMIVPLTRHGCGPSRYMSMRIAVNHVNRRDSTFCPAIATLKNRFEFMYDLADSNANGIISARAILRFLNNRSVTVKVVVGPNSSGSSMSMSNILAVFKIAHMSWAATNGRLSNKDDYPMFFRVVSPDSFTMSKLAAWIDSLGFKETNLAFFDAAFQSSAAGDFLQAAKVTHGMTVNEFSLPSSGAGGAAISDANMPLVRNVLRQILFTRIRVVVAIAINEEAYNFFVAVHDMRMKAEYGWMWCGGDGFSQGMLAGDSERLKYFEGVVYLQANTQGVNFPAYSQKWAELMPNTARPEFSEFPVCYDKESDLEKFCHGNSEFRGWQDGSHDVELKCTGYTPLAYDAVVTLAIVADALISNGKDINTATNEDWLAEMRNLSRPGFSFECLTGQISFNENQEREMALGLFNWQLDTVVPPLVMTWNGVDGYQWVVGATVVWPGGVSVMVNESNADPVPSGLPPSCNFGSVYSLETMMCEVCPNNTVFLENLGVCACEPGFAENETTGCYECEAGKHTSSPGMNACEDCPAGSFAGQTASTECIACSLGQYQGQAGSTACDTCGPGETTIMTSLKSSEGCKCETDKYRPLDGSECADCLAGMSCEFGSNAQNFGVHGGSNTDIPLLKKGYYSQVGDPLSVYECLDEDACPGGIPGACAGMREGLICASCPDSYAVNRAQGDCDPCAGGMTFLVVVSPILMIAALTAMYYLGNDAPTVNASIPLTTTVAAGIVVCCFQVLSVFRLLSVPWPGGFSPLLESMSVFNLNPDVVTLDCTMGTDTTVLYLLRILLPIVLVALLFLVYGFMNAIVVKILPITPWVFDKVLNTVGQVFQTLFIPFAIIVVRPFECFPHPNKESSVMLFPKVLCGSSEHTPLVVLALTFAALVLLPFVIVCTVANFRAPYLSSTSCNINGANRFLTRCRFLLYRFRPDTWWWGCVYLLRQILLAFAPSLPVDDPHAQIIYTCIVLSLYLMLLMCYWPWKNRSLNLLDSTSTYLLQLTITAATAFTPQSPNGSTYLAICTILASMIGVCIVVVMISVGMNVMSKGIRAPFEDQFCVGTTVHSENLAADFIHCSDLMNSLGPEKCEKLINVMNQHDRDLLNKSMQIWATVFNDFVPPETRKAFAFVTRKSSRLANVKYLNSKLVNVNAIKESMNGPASPCRMVENHRHDEHDSKPLMQNAEPAKAELTPRDVIETPRPEEAMLDWGRDVAEGPRGTPRGTPRLHGSLICTPRRVDIIMSSRTPPATPRA